MLSAEFQCLGVLSIAVAESDPARQSPATGGSVVLLDESKLSL